MKKLTMAIAIAAGVCGMANAQNTFKASNPGGVYIKGGVNFANISVHNDGSVNDAKTLTTFNVGLLGDIPLADVFSIQTGLYLNGKGSKTEQYFGSSTDHNFYKVKFNPLYLELPANFVVKLPIDDQARIYFGAGPYVAVGIGGKVKGTQDVGGITGTYEKNIVFNDDDPTTGEQEDASVSKLRRFDYGANLVAGIEINRLMLGVNYGLGLAKISSADDNNNNDKNKYRTFSINAGIRF